MFKLITDLIERRRQRNYWRYMRKLMDQSSPVVVQTYPVQPPEQK